MVSKGRAAVKDLSRIGSKTPGLNTNITEYFYATESRNNGLWMDPVLAISRLIVEITIVSKT